MSEPNQALFASVAIVVFALGMGGLHWLMVGINEQFGSGIAIGVALGGGLVFLASRKARETP
ncbi:hypothetical protein MKK75_06640 [Methylobacterium sp. J-030]|uniref:hypothetical protein n=1 Tax=Methylobacterium sp. J-030 TaxID=2836627 RepID=UPI001FB8E845|nr:hypothetical protein [Methylobacterium sp. J-030]MCJ2068486.1 hypothetical protein [Methylobacterium sp. J-030]